MARLLVLMGSGETTSTMVTPHQRILAAVEPGPRVVLDTPYGFQENADELSARTVEYFGHNVGQEVEVVSLRDAATAGSVELEVVTARVAEAAWVFAGPGSPSYLARNWLATSLPTTLRERLLTPGRATATVFASAAACTVGRLSIPVYELYKVGESPHWREGLDLLRPLGLDAIVVPHYDNAEGGTHDTSCCYIGERRLRALEAELEPGTWVLGVDEHTAAVIDLDDEHLRVEGRGRVVLRVRGQEHTVAAGEGIALSEIRDIVMRLGAAAQSAVGQDVPNRAVDEAGLPMDRFATAVRSGALLAAAEVTAELLDGLEDRRRVAVVRQIGMLARIAQAGLHEHRDLVAPHVEALLELRRTARSDRRFADADAIRDALVAAGIEVRDGDDATRWEFTDPIDALDTSAVTDLGGVSAGTREGRTDG